MGHMKELPHPALVSSTRSGLAFEGVNSKWLPDSVWQRISVSDIAKSPKITSQKRSV